MSLPALGAVRIFLSFVCQASADDGKKGARHGGKLEWHCKSHPLPCQVHFFAIFVNPAFEQGFSSPSSLRNKPCGSSFLASLRYDTKLSHSTDRSCPFFASPMFRRTPPASYIGGLPAGRSRLSIGVPNVQSSFSSSSDAGSRSRHKCFCCPGLPPAGGRHRGVSGYLPEHTLSAKAMAYAMGVDGVFSDFPNKVVRYLEANNMRWERDRFCPIGQSFGTDPPFWVLSLVAKRSRKRSFGPLSLARIWQFLAGCKFLRFFVLTPFWNVMSRWEGSVPFLSGFFSINVNPDICLMEVSLVVCQ